MATRSQRMQILLSAKDKAGKVITGIRRKLKKLGATARKVGRSIKNAFAKVGKSLFSFRTALVGAAGVLGMGYLIKRSMNTTDEMAKMSRAIGVSVENLQRLRHAANLGGMQSTQLDKAIQKLAINLADVAGGTGEALDEFKEFRIAAVNADGSMRDVMDVLADVADITKTLGDTTERTNLMYKLFGARGAKMVNMLKDGSEALHANMLEADLLGFVIGEKTVKGVEDANDAFTRMKSAMGGVFAKLSASLAPALEKFSDWWTRFIGVFSQTIQPLFVWLEQTLENIGVEFGTAEEAGKKWGNLIGWHIVDLTQKLIDFFTKVEDGKTDWENFKERASTAFESAKEGAQSFLIVINAIAKVINTIVAGFQKLNQFGYNLGVSLADHSDAAKQRSQKIKQDYIDEQNSSGGNSAGNSVSVTNNIYTQNSKHGVENALNSRGDMSLQVGRNLNLSDLVGRVWINGVLQ